MNRLLNAVWPLLAAGLLLVAFPSLAKATPSDEVALVLGVLRGRTSDQKLTKGLSEHLARSGLVVASEASLAAADRVCTDSACMDAIGVRTGAHLILTGELQQNNPTTVFITLALFDRLRHAPFEEKAVCDQCTAETLTGQLADIADKLVRQCRAARLAASSALPPTPPAVPSVPLVVENGNAAPAVGPAGQTDRSFLSGLSRPRRIAAGVMGGVAVATLVASVALQAADPIRTSSGCVLDTTRPGDFCEMHSAGIAYGGYAITGALAIAVAVTLFLPSERANKAPCSEENKQCKDNTTSQAAFAGVR